ncbi:hypothetical protein CHARACLAT_030574 [Characodon lateralis]|uniref:Uncharacterized protein n=1 Tax=Characodon lateralis TaxID=208331 RepID=A0ABU7DN07_9TELE|nr:hypothetical protein [Characodon lateralis]
MRTVKKQPSPLLRCRLEKLLHFVFSPPRFRHRFLRKQTFSKADVTKGDRKVSLLSTELMFDLREVFASFQEPLILSDSRSVCAACSEFSCNFASEDNLICLVVNEIVWFLLGETFEDRIRVKWLR